jgi:hypothetical protein
MPITARLSRTLHDSLGDEAAADLVDWMQHVDTHRAELRELNELMYARFDSRMNELRDVTAARIGELRHEVRADIGALRGELRVGLAELRDETHTGIAGLRVEMLGGFTALNVAIAEQKVALVGVESKIDRRFADVLKWSFVFWCGAVAAAALARGLR